MSTAPEAYALTTRPSELLIGTCYNFTINVVQWWYETVANRLVIREICRQYVALNQLGNLASFHILQETINEHALNTQ